MMPSGDVMQRLSPTAANRSREGEYVTAFVNPLAFIFVKATPSVEMEISLLPPVAVRTN